MSGCCGGSCTGCGGNYTYIRYASNATGADFALNQNDGGIKRCYMGIIVSDVELDESTFEFISYFNGRWINICNGTISGGGACILFGYHKPTSTSSIVNTWNFVGATETYTLDNSYFNAIKVDAIANGGKVLINSFKDSGGVLLTSEKNYFFSFNYDFTNLNVGDTVTVSFGQGVGATVFSFTADDGVGSRAQVITVRTGISVASTLVIAITTSGGASGDFIISNFQVSTEECGSGVITVTGDGVDNTDPKNPVMDLSDYAKKSDVFTGNGVIRGDAIWLYDLTYFLWASDYVIDGVRYDDGIISGEVTLDPAHATLNRIDVFKVINDGVSPPSVGIEKGDEDANPVKPLLDPDTEAEISFKFLPALETTPAEIEEELIYDEDSGDPLEWDTDSVAGTDNQAATDSPYSGTKYFQINTLDAIGVSSVWQLSSPSAVSLTPDARLIFFFRTSAIFDVKDKKLRISLSNSSVTAFAPAQVTLDATNLNDYGFDDTILNTWQLVSIPLSDFGGLSSFDTITLEFIELRLAGIDTLFVQKGVATGGEPVYKYFIELLDTPDSYSGHGGKQVKVKSTEDGVEFVTPELQVVTNDAYTGPRLSPSDPTSHGFEVRNDGNEQIGYRARNIGSGVNAYAGFVATISATLYQQSMSMQMMGANYNLAAYAGKGLMYCTEGWNISAINNNAIQFRPSPTSSISGGVLVGEIFSDRIWLKVKETADTGTVIDLGYTIGEGNLCNMASANSATTYTLTNVRAGAKAMVLINAASEPTVTGATKILGSTFIVSTDMYLCLFNNGNVTQYWFEQIAP